MRCYLARTSGLGLFKVTQKNLLGQRLFLVRTLTILIFIGIGKSAFAYIPTLTTDGKSVRWTGDIHINVLGNPINQSRLSGDGFFQSVTRSLNRWASASQGRIKFDYWQGTDLQVYPPDPDYNEISSISFLSNSSKARLPVARNVLGITQVWYSTDSGAILEADILLNDRDFNFTQNPTDTSGTGSDFNSPSQGKANVYIENVITHELGHALGLSHSGGLQSAMLFLESPEQAHLGCDELIGIHALYPTANDFMQRGTLSGRILSENGRPLFGAHVIAISQKRGTVLATGITNSSGDYLIERLEPGTYFILAEPFYAGSQALPENYSKINPSLCANESFFSRTFLTDSSQFNLLPLSVTAGTRTQAPSLTVQCSPSGGAITSTSSPHLGFINAQGQAGFGIIDQISPDQPTLYSVTGISGHVEIHVLAYGLYSPISPSISLYDNSGQLIPAQVLNPIYVGDSSYQNQDTTLVVDNLPAGNYTLVIGAASLDPRLYPAGMISLDKTPFFVVLGTSNMERSTLDRQIPFNARCRQEESFATYTSPPGPPPRSSSSSKNDQKTGFCSTISDNSDQPPNSSPPLGAVLGWLLPWSFMFGSIFITRAANRLRSQSHPATL